MGEFNRSDVILRKCKVLILKLDLVFPFIINEVILECEV